MLSIIVVSYNTRELLRQCLRSLGVHCPSAEVVVVDNASRDGSPEVVRAEFPAVKLIVLDRNVGFAMANNVGVQQAGREFILLLNSDTFVEDDSLDRCVAWIRAHPDVGAASPRLIGFDGLPQPCAHPFPCFQDKLRQTLRLPAGPARERAPGATGWLIGAALMLRRDVLRQLDSFLDAAYFMYWEDADLCARLLRAGWKLAIFDQGYVRHRGGASSSSACGGQRPELHACFLRGKYRWYARYRPRWESAGLWALDAVEVFRKFFRGILRPGRRAECLQARTLAGVLCYLLLRQTPRAA